MITLLALLLTSAWAQEDLIHVRDPFKRPDAAVVNAAPKLPLEQFPLDQIKMIGVLTGPVRIRALVQTPDGKTHFVAEKMKMGQRSGVVRKIMADAILVREKVVDVFGQEENLDSQIRLQLDTAKAGGSR